MAGIGFVLNKILKKGGIGSFLKVAVTGMIVVAGPWLIAIIGIFVINNFIRFTLTEGPALFMAIIVYTYASSLFIFGGFHYIFTRFVADLVYVKKQREASAALIIFSLIILIASSIVAYIAMFGINIDFINFGGIHRDDISHLFLLKISAWIFYSATNILWILMIFISMLKRYIAIFISFLTGMVLSVAGVFYFGSIFGLGGSMLGFSLGQVIATILLFILSLKEYRPKNFKKTFKTLFSYFGKYKYLLLCGIFYYWAIWIDKFVYWFALGYHIKGTFFMLYDAYDIPVYISNLSMIPGLIYFVVISETDFYIHLKNFLDSLSNSILSIIQEKKIFLIDKFKQSLQDQSLFQGLFTFLLILIAPAINKTLFSGSVDLSILRISFLAVFFHFIYLTFMTFMFYMELYPQAAFTSFIFFFVNISYSVSMEILGYQNLPGLSYLLGAFTASVIALIFLVKTVKKIDQKIFSNYN